MHVQLPLLGEKQTGWDLEAVRMQRTPADVALEVRVARLVEESSLGTAGARQLRTRARLARGAAGMGWDEADQCDLLAMIDGLPRAAEC
jgi:hypothetical protein